MISGRVQAQPHRPAASPRPPPPASAGPSTSSLPPKPPPQAEGMIRTRSRGEPEHAPPPRRGPCRAPGWAEDLDPVALALGVAGLGLDIGVLDEAGLERSTARVAAEAASAASASPLTTRPRISTLSGPAGVDRRCAPVPAPRRCRGPRGSGSQAIGSSSSRTAATAARSPTSASTGSPRCRTSPSASTGWSFRSG